MIGCSKNNTKSRAHMMVTNHTMEDMRGWDKKKQSTHHGHESGIWRAQSLLGGPASEQKSVYQLHIS
jgi:hypothetical protein